MSKIKNKEMAFHFDPVRLCEVADDPAGMTLGIKKMLEELSQLNSEVEKAQLRVRIGAYQRVAGQYDESAVTLRDAIAFFQKQNMSKLYWTAQLRLAVTLQTQQKMKDAEDIYLAFTKQLEGKLKDDLKSLADYALFHWALLRFHTMQFQAAMDDLIRCLELRLAKGEIELIQQTQGIIDIVRDKLDKPA